MYAGKDLGGHTHRLFTVGDRGEEVFTFIHTSMLLKLLQ